MDFHENRPGLMLPSRRDSHVALSQFPNSSSNSNSGNSIRGTLVSALLGKRGGIGHCLGQAALALCMLAIAASALWLTDLAVNEVAGADPGDTQAPWSALSLPSFFLLSTASTASTTGSTAGTASAAATTDSNASTASTRSLGAQVAPALASPTTAREASADGAAQLPPPCTPPAADAAAAPLVPPAAPAPCTCDSAGSEGTSSEKGARGAATATAEPGPGGNRREQEWGAEGAAGPAEGKESPRVLELLEAWSRAYGLRGELPPAQVSWKNQTLLRKPRWAPHLEECSALEEMRARHEGFNIGSRSTDISTGSSSNSIDSSINSTDSSSSSTDSSSTDSTNSTTGYPAWVCAGAEGQAPCDSPRPPWVPGGDDDNLPLTRVAQRDLWMQQFPAHECRDERTRFLVVMWGDQGWHGVGSQLLMLSMALGAALQSGRVLVPQDYARADHPGCDRFGRRSEFDCYFAPITSYSCLRRGRALVASRNMQPTLNWQEALDASRDVVFLNREAMVNKLTAPGEDIYWERVKPLLGLTVRELLGSVEPGYDEKLSKVSWLRTQMFQFLLRWPSAYLCHLTNQARHRAFGHLVAREVADSEAQQEALEGGTLGHLDAKEKEALHSNDAKAVAAEETPEWRFPREPYVPRPIVSVHVRQGDKGGEMRLFGFESYMWTAYRLRRAVPGIRNIWLSTEMEAVVNATKEYKGWNFFYTEVPRQLADVRMSIYEQKHGLEQRVGDSYVNLMVASQCDYFVGVLGSTWNRVLNALRMTGGRMKSTYMALNDDVW